MRNSLVALPLLAACATAKPPAPAPEPAPEAAPTIPPELRVHVEDASVIGRALYKNDKVSALGTDVLLEHLGSLEGKNIGGYLTMEERGEGLPPGSMWQVEFFT